MDRKKDEEKEKRKRSTSSPKPDASVQVGNISKTNGDVNIAARDIIKNIQIISERALTPGEIAEKDLEIEINKLAEGVRDCLDDIKRQVVSKDTSTPYKGLVSYAMSDVSVFFGRDQAIHDLREAMRRGQLTVLQAESGAGKTSLLQAGIIPLLINEGNLAVWIRPQFDNPVDKIKKTFIGNLDAASKLAKTPLAEFLKHVERILGDQTDLFLILDQFEEFFSKQTLDEYRQDFIRELAECLNHTTLKTRWVISITSDTFGQLGKFEPYIRNPFSNARSLYLFNRQEATEIISKPANSHGILLEEGLTERLLDELSQGKDALFVPTQIQLVCAALYEDIKEHNLAFTIEQYEQKGGARKILHNYIGDVLRFHLPPEERTIAYKIFEELVTSEKKRIIRVKSDIETVLENKGVSRELTESTLNHLVNRRLLRQSGDHGAQLQYEIVHDYLLKEIEISEEVKRTKDAEELLEQGRKNWTNHKMLIAPNALEVIEEQSDKIFFSDNDVRLLFLSAIGNKKSRIIWEKLLNKTDLDTNIYQLIDDKQKIREAKWLLRKHLPITEKVTIILWKYFSTSAKMGVTGIKTIMWIVFTLMLFGLLFITTSISIKSNFVASFNNQCLEGENSTQPLVAIDTHDPSHVVTFDSNSSILCQSLDTAATWNTVESETISMVHSLAVYKSIYLATDKTIYWMDANNKWRQITPPSFDQSITNMIVDENKSRIIVTLSNSVILEKSIGKLASNDPWINISTTGIAGDILDITINHKYIAVSTTTGIWYTEVEPIFWEKFEPMGYKNSIFPSIAMTYPKKVFPISTINPLTDDYIMVIEEGGTIYSGALTENWLNDFQLNAIEPKAIAANGTSVFVSTNQGIACSQVWYINNEEWRLYKYGPQKPCY